MTLDEAKNVVRNPEAKHSRNADAAHGLLFVEIVESLGRIADALDKLRSLAEIGKLS